jgi:esterase/lipase
MDKLKKEDICFILVPGFDYDAEPVSRLDTYLRRQGYATRPTSFWGDGPMDFSKLDMEECLEGLRRVIAETAMEYSYVIGIGTSLGAAMLLDCAKGDTSLSAVVSIGAPFRLKFRRTLRMLIRTIYPILRKWWTFAGINSKWLAGKQVVKYLDGVFQENIDQVKIPVLFLQSTRDMVALRQAIEEYFSIFGAKAKKNVYVRGVNHSFWGHEAIVYKEFSEFLSEESFNLEFNR